MTKPMEDRLRLRAAAQAALDGLEALVKDPQAEDLMTKLNSALIMLRLALRADAGSSPWQSIETAPKDGTPILGYCDQGPVVIRHSYGSWMVDNSHGYNEDGEVYGVTDWMPLPGAPK